MATYTTRYALTKPTVGGDADVWGTGLNQTIDDADALLGAITTTGSANAYVLTTGLSLAAYVTGQSFDILASFSNSSTVTINVDGLGAKAITKNGTTALASGDIVSGNAYRITYDGTRFQLIGTTATGVYQTLDATLTALAAAAYTSGVLIFTLTAADTVAMLATGTSGAVVPLLNGNNTYGGTALFSGVATFGAAPVPDGSGTRNFGSSTALWGAGFFTTIELGHANDCTFSRATTGTVLLEGAGNVVRVSGATAVPIPASAMVANTTNGAAAGTSETTTNDVMYRTFDFDATTQEAVQFLIPMPKSWNESTVTFQPIWTASAGTPGATVVWDCAGVALSDDDALDTAFGTEQTSSDVLLATDDVHIGPASSAITIAGTPAEGDLVIFRVRRVPASDNLPNDAKLIAVRLTVTMNAKNDA